MSEDSIKKTISVNIAKYRELAGMTQKELAKKLDITPSRVSNWEQGANCPTIDILFEVCEVLGVSINDIYGVYPDAKIRLSYDEIDHIKKYRFISEHSPEGIETVNYILNREYKVAEQIRDSTKSDSESNIRYIQRYPRVASAGTGQVVFEDMPVDRIGIPDIPKYKRVSYAIEVNGNSMEPLYFDEDILLIEPTCQIDVGEIGIFIVGNEAYVKKLGEGELISLNRGYDNIPLTEDSKCMGRVVDKL